MATMKKQWLTKALEDWHKQMEAAAEDGIIDEAEAEALRKDYERIVTNANEEYKRKMDALGIDLSEIADPTERQGSKGLAASMTQDQATEMNGFLNNGLIFWRDISENTREIRAQMQASGTNTDYFKNATQGMLTQLQAINENTFYCRRLDGMDSDMRLMRAAIQDIRDRGITLKS
jgi:hypothetical protein